MTLKLEPTTNLLNNSETNFLIKTHFCKNVHLLLNKTSTKILQYFKFKKLTNNKTTKNNQIKKTVKIDKT